MDPIASKMNALVLELAHIYFNENIAVHLDSWAWVDGFWVQNLFGATACSPSGVCGCVMYRIGEKLDESEQLFVKPFCRSPEADQQPSLAALYFSVELHFHSQVVPLFNRLRAIDHLVPRFYVGRAESTATYDVGAIVFQHVQDCRSLGYSQLLDRQMLSLALRKIAEFHAYSFRARRSNVAFGPSLSHRIHTDHMPTVVETLDRCLQPLALAGEYCGWVPRLRNLIENLEFRMQLLLSQRNTDGCVLCHRNYSQANILFHFDPLGSQVIDLRIVNWQWMGFASLGVDLVILLFVETYLPTLREHWKDLLNEYCKSLYATFEDPLLPDYDRVFDELKASVPLALYMLALRANHLHLQTSSLAAINMSSSLWNEDLITDVFKELIRRNLV